MCEQYGIQFQQTEESYTSKASFLDGDYLPTIGEKPQDWKPSGRRIKRGLYRVGYGQWYINADCNGAANILRKAIQRGLGGFPHERLNQDVSTKDLSACTLGLDLSRLSRGVLSHPHRIKLWSVNRNKNTERSVFRPS